MPKKQPSSPSKPTPPQTPLFGKPVIKSFPTPDQRDRVFVVRKDTRASGYKLPKQGDAFDGVDEPGRLPKDYVFAQAMPVDQPDIGFTDHYYIATRKDQEQYNFVIDFPFVDKNWPRYTRTYVVPRTDDLVTKEPNADDFDPVFGKPFQLTDHKIERWTDDPVLDSLFVKVTRVFERLPSPIITTFESNQYQQPVTVKTQEVMKGAPPPQSSVTEAAKQERTGTAKAKNTLASVPSLFPQTDIAVRWGSAFRDPLPLPFRYLIPLKVTSQVVAGKVNPPTLGIGDLDIQETQLTLFKKKVTTIHYDVTDQEIDDVRVNRYQQLESVTQNIHQGEQTFSIDAKTVGGKIEHVGGGATLRTIEKVPALFPDEEVSSSIPDLRPEEFRGMFPTITESHREEGTVNPNQPPALLTGELERSQHAETELIRKVTVKKLQTNPLPQTVHNQELGGKEFGGGVIDVAMTLDNPNSGMTVDKGMLVTESSVKHLGAAGDLKVTKELLSLEDSSIDVLNPGMNYTSPPTISFSPSGNGAVATPIMGKSIASLTILDGGGEYDFPPAVEFYGDNGEFVTPAVGVAFISRGVAQLIPLRYGAGYLTAPIMNFRGGAGSGAAGFTTIAYGVDHINVTNQGTGYGPGGGCWIQIIPAAGDTGSGAVPRHFVDNNGHVTGIILLNGGAGYSVPPTIKITDTRPGGTGTGATAVAVLKTTGYINSFQLTASGNYLFAPEVYFTGGGGGSGAQVVAIMPTQGAGTLSSVAIPFGGLGYTLDTGGNVRVKVRFKGGSRNTAIRQASATVNLSSTYHVAAINLDVAGNFDPNIDQIDPTPTVVFTGGGGSGTDAQYIIGGWPVLYSSIVDPKYGLVTQITKRVVPAKTKWRPGLGFTEIHPHDFEHSIMVTSKTDLRSLPAPVVYPTVRTVSLPPILQDVTPNWVTTIDEGLQGVGIPPDQPAPFALKETAIAVADIKGSISVQAQKGYSGPAVALVTELFFYTPPDMTMLPVPLKIQPVFGTAQMFTQSSRVSKTQGLRAYGHDNRHTTQIESKTIGPVLSGSFFKSQSFANNLSISSVGSDQNQGEFIIQGPDDFGSLAASGVVGNKQLLSNGQYGWNVSLTHTPALSITATASGMMVVSMPVSDPPELPSGAAFVEHMQTERLGLDVWKVTIVQVYVP